MLDWVLGMPGCQECLGVEDSLVRHGSGFHNVNLLKENQSRGVQVVGKLNDCGVG